MHTFANIALLHFYAGVKHDDLLEAMKELFEGSDATFKTTIFEIESPETDDVVIAIKIKANSMLKVLSLQKRIIAFLMLAEPAVLAVKNGVWKDFEINEKDGSFVITTNEGELVKMHQLYKANT